MFLLTLCESQAECDDLAQRADSLKEENASLKAEVNHIRSKYEQLLAENASLKVTFNSQLFNSFKLLQMLSFYLGLPR